MKRWLLVLVALGLLSVFLVACGGSENTVSVSTDTMNFAQSSITLKKGQSLQVNNTASDMHILGLGRWQNGVAQPEQEPGAPSFNDLQLSGNSSVTIGPWNTLGTYSVYCSIHTNMMLTVIVQ